MKSTMSRRELLRYFGLASAGLALGACQAKVVKETVLVEKAVEKVVKETVIVAGTPKVVEKEVTKVVEKEVTKIVEKAMVSSRQAPELQEMVKAGVLPPLEKRLPLEPLVVEPIESVGKYGGTWHRGWRGIKDFHCFGRLTYETMLRWPRDPADPVQPGLAKAWEWSDGGKTLTLHLRKGLKWSDGAAFTVDDIIFWWEAIETDTNVSAAPHAEWMVAGKPMELEKVDDTTIKLKFAGPNGLAETVGLAFHGNQWPLGFERFGFFAPKHYLEQFHPKYDKSGTYKLFEEKAFDYNTERPAMTPWRVTEWETGADHMLATRNPYYWKVDIEGNQLPYIDELYFYLVEDVPAINMLAIAGKLDMQARSIDLAQVTVYQENADAGDYHLLQWSSASASGLTFFPNQSYSDPVYRELMQNLKFRQALSLGIDRDLINDVAWLGQAIPRTTTVVRDSALFQPDIEMYYAEYDPDKGKALLDEIPLPVGGDGKRTFADGSPLELVMETCSSGSGLDTLELVAENWRALGLKVAVKSMTRDVWWPRACANEVMIGNWGTDRGLVPMIDPIYQFPFDERSWMAPSFGTWYKTAGKEGEAPTPDMKELMDLYDQYKGTTRPDEQLDLAKKIVKLSTERLYVIETCGMAPGLVVVKNNFHNVAEDHCSDWLIMTPGTQDPCHFWMEQE